MDQSEQSLEQPKRHPLNATGDFYVEHGNCLQCEVPKAAAPDLFSNDGEMHCYVSKQPASSLELLRMIRIFWSQDLGCIRYAGTDRTLLERIAAVGGADYCDAPVAEPLVYRWRDVVTFRVDPSAPEGFDGMCADFISWQKEAHHIPYDLVGRRVEEDNSVVLRFSWYEQSFHELRWSELGSERIALECVGDMSYVLYDWVSTRGYLSDAQWFTRDEWARDAPGAALPW